MTRLEEIFQSGNIQLTGETVGRKQYLDYMTFRATQPVLFSELFGPMVGLKEEWTGQGAGAAELDFSAFPFRFARDIALPVNTGWLGNNERVLEETDQHIIVLDKMGRTLKLIKASATLPLPLNYPVQNMADWLKIKSHYAFTPGRIASNFNDIVKQYKNSEHIIGLAVPGGFDEPRQLLGEEQLCLSYYTQPELIHDILTTIADMLVPLIEIITKHITVDQVFIHEDLAGKSGPLVGPKQFEEFIRPYYSRIFEPLRAHGCRLFNVDSDGNINNLLDCFIRAGVNMIGPMEPSAGMDIVKVRDQYGRKLALWGGIDKYVLGKTQADIEAELLYKIPPMIKTGGCILGLDHRLPNGTPLANYKFYIKKAWDIINRESTALTASSASK